MTDVATLGASYAVIQSYEQTLPTTYKEFGEYYWDKPHRFVFDCIDFPIIHGEYGSPAPYQMRIAFKLAQRRRVSVRSLHGVGKTALASWLVHWFALTRDALEVDWKVICTASAWRQLTRYLAPEIVKWGRRLRWNVIGREPYNLHDELLTQSLKLGYGSAFMVASNDPATIEGAHATELLYLFDESKIIPAETWNSAEGAFSTGSCYWFAISTPGVPEGTFYDIQSRKDGYEDWHVERITLPEAVSAHRIDMAWADQRKRQWGEESSMYRNRVLGEFADAEADGLVSLAQAEKANDLYDMWDSLPDDEKGVFVRTICDVARFGDDKTVMADLWDWNGIKVFTNWKEYSKISTMATTGHIVSRIRDKTGKATVDVVGLGSGVVDRLREQKYKVIAFNNGSGTDAKDRAGEFEFSNVRSASYWNVREMHEDNLVAYPSIEKLTRDLTVIHWAPTSGGKIVVEKKEEIRKRLKRSTDYSDVIAMGLWKGDTKGSGLV